MSDSPEYAEAADITFKMVTPSFGDFGRLHKEGFYIMHKKYGDWTYNLVAVVVNHRSVA